MADFERLFDQGNEDIALTVLVTGDLVDGQPFWAYCRMHPKDFFTYQQVRAQGAFDLEDFGEVLASGEGHEPPDAVKAAMAERFGADPAFEDELIEAAEKLVRELSDTGSAT